MSKQITQSELAEIVGRILRPDGDLGGGMDADVFLRFMTDVAQVVCDYEGGEIHHPASDFDGVAYIGIHGNECLPDDGGVWADYDREGELNEQTTS